MVAFVGQTSKKGGLASNVADGCPLDQRLLAPLGHLAFGQQALLTTGLDERLVHRHGTDGDAVATAGEKVQDLGVEKALNALAVDVRHQVTLSNPAKGSK